MITEQHLYTGCLRMVGRKEKFIYGKVFIIKRKRSHKVRGFVYVGIWLCMCHPPESLVVMATVEQEMGCI
jgi:hypothetical protein